MNDRATRVATLRAELRDDTAFVATPTPRLSWTVESAEPGWLQASAELSDGLETVTLDGRASVLVAWPFAPLAPGERRDVTVRVRADVGRRDRLERAAAGRGGLPRRRRVGRRSRSASPHPAARGAAGAAAHELHARPAGRARPPVLDRARRRRARAQRLSRSRTTSSPPAGRATATGSSTRRSMSPRSSARARTCSAHRSPAAGTPRSTGSSPSRPASTAPSRRSSASSASRTPTARPRRSRPPATAGRAFGDGPVVDSGIYPGEHQDLRRTLSRAGRTRGP